VATQARDLSNDCGSCARNGDVRLPDPAPSPQQEAVATSDVTVEGRAAPQQRAYISGVASVNYTVPTALGHSFTLEEPHISVRPEDAIFVNTS
jgi:hypothetical protein